MIDNQTATSSDEMGTMNQTTVDAVRILKELGLCRKESTN